MRVEGKIKQEINQMDAEEKDTIMENFSRFKTFLADKVEIGENLGMSDEQLAKTTEFIASYLAKHEEPRNREQYLLQELWDVGSKEERHALANVILKMVREA